MTIIDEYNLPRPCEPIGDWRSNPERKCIGQTTIFFPEDSDSCDERAFKERAAIARCNLCPVEKDCYTWSIVNAEEFGVWGGVGEKDRRKVIRHRVQIQETLEAIAV